MGNSILTKRRASPSLMGKTMSPMGKRPANRVPRRVTGRRRGAEWIGDRREIGSYKAAGTTAEAAISWGR
ncbi:MAG: hypothetical protein IPP07_07925 [Holophagales bacterium]|nr:hypothetical protein [Holophagales bacterium]